MFLQGLFQPTQGGLQSSPFVDGRVLPPAAGRDWYGHIDRCLQVTTSSLRAAIRAFDIRLPPVRRRRGSAGAAFLGGLQGGLCVVRFCLSVRASCRSVSILLLRLQYPLQVADALRLGFGKRKYSTPRPTRKTPRMTASRSAFWHPGRFCFGGSPGSCFYNGAAFQGGLTEDISEGFMVQPFKKTQCSRWEESRKNSIHPKITG